MIVRYKRRTLRDLEFIHAYIAQSDPAAASRAVERIRHSIGRLNTLPLSGRPGVGPGTRLLAIPSLPYVVIHRVRDEFVDIIAVLHTLANGVVEVTNTMRTHGVKRALALLFVVWLVTPALASEPQVGRWAVDPQNCTGGGGTYRTSALTVTPRTLSWASEYCTIGKMYKADRALYIEGRCSKGGIATTHPITLAMKGERLAVTWNGERSELRRCPGSY